MICNAICVYTKGTHNKYCDTVNIFDRSSLDVNLVTSIYTVTFVILNRKNLQPSALISFIKSFPPLSTFSAGKETLNFFSPPDCL